jgi:hypothetical protein
MSHRFQRYGSSLALAIKSAKDRIKSEANIANICVCIEFGHVANEETAVLVFRFADTLVRALWKSSRRRAKHCVI